MQEYEVRFLRMMEKLGGRVSVGTAGSAFP